MSKLGQFKTDWIKYSDYEIKKNKEGIAYIIPTENSEFTIYNPFDVTEELIFDLIQLGDEVLNSNREEQVLYEGLLVFVKKYGLLGLASASVYNRHIIGEEEVLFIEGNLLTDYKTMSAYDYMKWFLPFVDEEDIIIKKMSKEIVVIKAEDSPKFYGKRPLILDVIFSRFYGERIEWLLAFAQNISEHFNQLLIYRNQSLTDEVTILAGKFKADKIGLTVTMLEEPTLSWEFDALKTAIETLYAFEVTDKEYLLNRCIYCHKLFRAKSLREKYCSPSCRNCANVIKSRKKKKLGQIQGS